MAPVEHKWMAEAVLFILEARADYHMRVLRPARTYPYLLLWLIWKPCDEECSERKECARDLLTDPGETITDVTTIKFSFLFGKQLEEASRTGMLHPRVHALVTAIAAAWRTDTQEVEGVNDVLKHVYRLGPNISWPLLSSRLTIKKFSGLLGSSRERRRAFVRECADFHDTTEKFLCEHTLSSRLDMVDMASCPYEKPEPIPRLSEASAPAPDEVCCAKIAMRFAKAWLDHHGHALQPSTIHVIRVELKIRGESAESAEGPFMVPSLKFRQRTLWVTMAKETACATEVEADAADANRLATLRMPLQCRSFVAALRPLHHEVLLAIRDDAAAVATSDMILSATELVWDRRSLNTASVVEGSETEILRMSSVCRCNHEASHTTHPIPEP